MEYVVGEGMPCGPLTVKARSVGEENYRAVKQLPANGPVSVAPLNKRGQCEIRSTVSMWSDEELAAELASHKAGDLPRRLHDKWFLIAAEEAHRRGIRG